VCGANRQDASFTAEALASVVVPLPLQPPQQRQAKVTTRRDKNGKLTRRSRKQLLRQWDHQQRSSDHDVRALPYLRADGNFAKVPTRLQAKQQGYRLWAPQKSKGQSRRGLGIIRSSVERGHALLNPFGRIFRRMDRRQGRYLAWVQLASCIIFMRQGFFP